MAAAESAGVRSKLPRVIEGGYPKTGTLPRSQSYLLRPVDPEMVTRVQRSLAKFNGPKSAGERERIIFAKAEGKKEASKAFTQEYVAWAKKVKAETEPCFKFPEDPTKGRLSSDEYIQMKVEDALHDMHERDHHYQKWLKDLKDQRDYELEKKLEEKAQADEAFDMEALSREQDRIQRDAEIQQLNRQQEGQYWTWLRDMKEQVAKTKRSASTPVINSAGLDSVAALTKKKKEESMKEFDQRRKEYYQWLAEVSKPRFQLPYHEVVSFAERTRRADVVRQRAEGHRKASVDYFQQMRHLERKHHQRIMRSVQKKLQADKNYNEAKASEADAREVKMEECRQRQREIELKERQMVKEMYHRVKAKPLILELAYD